MESRTTRQPCLLSYLLTDLPTYLLTYLGRVHHYGVEDYTTAMLQKTIEAFPVATVQQEINLLVRYAGTC